MIPTFTVSLNLVITGKTGYFHTITCSLRSSELEKEKIRKKMDQTETYIENTECAQDKVVERLGEETARICDKFSKPPLVYQPIFEEVGKSL